MLRRRALLLVALTIAGCGGRTPLGLFGLITSDEPPGAGSGGSTSQGGSLASGGKAMGGVAGGKSSGGASIGGAPSGEGGAPSVDGGTPSGEGGTPPAQGGAGGEAPILRAPSDLALGAFHSCARFDDGSLRCWGTGGYIGSASEVTIGDNELPTAIGDVMIGGFVSELSASWYTTCARFDSGKLRCFGAGLLGQLGYGHTNDIGDDETPASAGDVNVGGPVTQVSAGPLHTCAVIAAGNVLCWGSNSYGQLGSPSGETIGDDEAPVTADYVDVGGSVTQVAAGFGHTCALLDTGKVRCWGSGGRLGYGHTDDIGDDETPASAGDVDVGGVAVQIVAGVVHTCALLDAGKVRCWGSPNGGVLGYGNGQAIGDDETPASAGDVDVGGPVSQLVAGDHATCARLAGGTVRCWGSAEHGQLGYGNLENIGDDETPASAGDIDLGGQRALRIDAGFRHACAVLQDGGVRCWGRASTGALGYGNTNDIGDDEPPSAAGDVQTH